MAVREPLWKKLVKIKKAPLLCSFLAWFSSYLSVSWGALWGAVATWLLCSIQVDGTE